MIKMCISKHLDAFLLEKSLSSSEVYQHKPNIKVQWQLCEWQCIRREKDIKNFFFCFN